MIINGAASDLVGLKYSLPSTSKRVSGPAYGKVLTDLVQDNKCDGDDLSNIDAIRVSEETFGKIDVNKDGLDDQPKLESNLRELTIVPITQRIIQDKDADGDGALSVDEMGISEEVFAKLDANEDGLLDQSELESGLHELGKSRRAERMIQNRDVDGDGALSVDEMGISEEAFAKLDANEDGLLDQSELESGLPELGKTIWAERMIQDKDADGDGVLSVDEMGIPEETFARLDANEDGLLDQSELESHLPEVNEALRAQRMMQNMDTDGDGALSVDEMGISEEAFVKLDANEDGLLDQGELESGLPELGTILRAETDNEMPQTMGEMPPADKLQSLNSVIVDSYLRVHSMTQNSENNSNLSALKDGVNFIA
jgi:Ca2+-binding EF-hand superfamily protein